ncbi:MAG TPA: T9SS type A sorting domain-containing protein [Draconibacterium sp.]|jgi:hypothetical protein|nr:T9SS type A sorting domain-containing protein [Draconibacterium sp.]
MKNFTFLIIVILISFSLNAQNKNDLHRKIGEFNEKYNHYNQKITRFVNSVNFYESVQVLKSAAATQKLDSTVNRVFNDESQSWQNDYKDEFVYDSELKNTAWLGKVWNSDTKAWELDYKTEFGFNNNDQINSMLVYDRDSANKAVEATSKTQFYYNSGGQHDSILTYYTENAGLNWELMMKQVHHYNASKQLVKTDLWGFDEDEEELILSSNTVYTYYAHGKIKSSATSFVFEGDEFPTSKTDYTYDGSNRLITEENSILNFMNLNMEKSSQYSYQYNASGQLVTEIYSKWDGASWINDDREQYQYNAAGDLNVEIYSDWDGAAWIEQEKYETIYGTTNFADVVFPTFIYLYDIDAVEFVTNKIVTSTNEYEMIDGSWKNTDKTAFYYSGGTSTNINEIENSVVSVYPNPASESINFSWKGNHEALSLQIYQITGAKVIEQTVYSGRPVSISHLEDGVYLYKLLNGQQNVKTGKMIKR